MSKFIFWLPLGQSSVMVYVLISEISTTLLLFIPVNPGGFVAVQENAFIWISLIMLPIKIPFLYSDTLIASTPVMIFGGVTHKLPVIGSNVDPPPTGLFIEYGAI